MPERPGKIIRQRIPVEKPKRPVGRPPKDPADRKPRAHVIADYRAKKSAEKAARDAELERLREFESMVCKATVMSAMRKNGDKS